MVRSFNVCNLLKLNAYDQVNIVKNMVKYRKSLVDCILKIQSKYQKYKKYHKNIVVLASEIQIKFA